MIPTQKTKPKVPLLTAFAVALGIFIVDTLSPFEFAVAVLYVFAVLIAATYLDRRSVVVAAAASTALTVLSLLLVHGPRFPDTAILRAAMGLAAIGITTFLALQNMSANERLGAAQRQRANLARFFSPQIVDELAEMDKPLSLTRHQPAVVLFVDMVGFTEYCTRLAPEEVIAFLRDLQALLSKCVFSHNGTIDKFLGDGLMAVFGPPLPSSADATNAARCVLEILDSIANWNTRRLKSGEEKIRMAVGVHHGPIVQGDIGSENMLELTVVGDTVNVASRVEAFCRTLDFDLLVTASFIDALHAEGSGELAQMFADLGHHELRGRAEPIHLYGIIGLCPDLTMR
jgi:class 3 adenylate cyclase